MNPYPHHPALTGSPHHPPSSGGGGGGGVAGGEPHHGGYGSAASGNDTATTPDPSPHSPPYGSAPQDTGPQGYPGSHQQQAQGVPSNGHHHAAAAAAAAAQAMQQAQQDQHHRPYQHPHLQAHMTGYPPVNHNNNCTIKQEPGAGMVTSAQQCAGCGNRIVDKWLLHALERYWHNHCLKCTSCGQVLADMGQTFYLKNNMVLCKNDYWRMFGPTGACANCHQTIPGNEFVMKECGSVFHSKCFTCTKCGTRLTSGDRYYLLNGAAVCETDYQKLYKSSQVAGAAAATATGNGGMPTRKGKVGRPRRSRE